MGRAWTYRTPQLLRALLLDGDAVPDQAPHVQDLEAGLVKVGLLCREVVQQGGDIRLDTQKLNADLCSSRYQTSQRHLPTHALFTRRNLAEEGRLTSLVRSAW